MKKFLKIMLLSSVSIIALGQDHDRDLESFQARSFCVKSFLACTSLAQRMQKLSTDEVIVITKCELEQRNVSDRNCYYEPYTLKTKFLLNN